MSKADLKTLIAVVAAWEDIEKGRYKVFKSSEFSIDYIL